MPECLWSMSEFSCSPSIVVDEADLSFSNRIGDSSDKDDNDKQKMPARMRKRQIVDLDHRDRDQPKQYVHHKRHIADVENSWRFERIVFDQYNE